jgi:uncharacterized protein YbjT (DUF2867 family)
MNILVVGGTGLIGSAVVARLVARGHRVVVASRRPDPTASRHVVVDLGRIDEAAWRPLLRDIEGVVNCAGVLQDAPGDSTVKVHHTGIESLFRACETLHVRKVVHFSAMGVERKTPSDFSRSKRAGDEALMQRDLDWVILRPSVVIGRAAYGASALMRGLAALPIVPVMPDGGGLQVVWLDDVVATVEHALSPDAAGKQIIELAGPKTYSFEEVVARLRHWMRWRPARTIRMPRALATLIYKLGDMVSWLGWAPPIRSNAQREMVRGAVASQRAKQMPVEPTLLEKALAREPASAQERWFARLYFVKPLVFAVLALFWLSTAFVSLGPGWHYGIGLMHEGGVEGAAAALTVIAGALADLAIGLAIAFRRTARFGLYAAIVLSFSYAIIGTILVPRLWADPLGPMLKIWPIIVLHVVALAIREDR